MTASTQPAPTVIRNDTEARLLDKALTLFASKGYAATSVREIIEAVGVTRPVLYYYCDSKQHLFERVVRWKHDDAYRELACQISVLHETPEQLRAIIRGTFLFCAADPRVPQLMFQTTFGPAVSELSEFLNEMSSKRFAIVDDVIQKGMAAGVLRGGNASLLTLFFCSIMDHHVNTFSRLPHPQQWLTVELADALVDGFLHGVASGPKQTFEFPNTHLPLV